MIRESQAKIRKRRFLLLRYALIVISGLLGYLETLDRSQIPLLFLVVIMLGSNIYLGSLSPFAFFDANTQAVVLVADTGLISCVLLLARAGQEFFFFFFFALIMVAKIDNLMLLMIVAVSIGLLTLFLPDVEGGVVSPAFLRIPFLLATTLFYGYIVLPERTGEMSPLGGGAAPRRVG